MKSIKNIALSALFTIGAFTAVTYTSCNQDECKDVVCQNGGTCSGGDCSCPTGYEGNLCETASVTKFVGTWTVAESCGGTSSTPYQVTITGSGTQLLISNLGNYGCTVGGNIVWTGNLSNSVTVIINDDKCGTQMNATGTYANGVISFTYTAQYGTTTDNCTATLTK